MSETELVDFFEKESAETTATMKPDHEETYKQYADSVHLKKIIGF